MADLKLEITKHAANSNPAAGALEESKDAEPENLEPSDTDIQVSTIADALHNAIDARNSAAPAVEPEPEDEKEPTVKARGAQFGWRDLKPAELSREDEADL